MKKKFKKLFCLLLSVMLLCSIFSMTVDAATYKDYTTSAGNTISVTNSLVVYYDGTGEQMGSISISGLKSSQKIAKSSVKSSNKKVAKLSTLGHSSYSSKSQYWDGSDDQSDSGSYANITFYVKGTGTSKISYKIAGKTYTSTVKSLAYTNPLKTVTISGVNKKANIASKLKKTSSATVKLSSTQKNPAVTLKAASGWKITYAFVSESQDEESRNSYYNNYKGTSSAVLYPGRLTKGHEYFLSIGLENTKTGGDISCTYTIK